MRVKKRQKTKKRRAHQETLGKKLEKRREKLRELRKAAVVAKKKETSLSWPQTVVRYVRGN